jgi:hypothetical protein
MNKRNSLSDQLLFSDWSDWLFFVKIPKHTSQNAITEGD